MDARITAINLFEIDLDKP